MVLLVQHAFQGPSGEGDDHFINTFHVLGGGVESYPAYFAEFASGSSGPTVGEEWARIFRSFYIGHASLAADNPLFYLSRAVFNLGEYLKVFDLGAPPHSPPVFSYMYDDVIGDSTTARPLPCEVALCVSIEGFTTGTLAGTGPGSKARRRNRIYFGPLNQEAEAAGTSAGVSTPSVSLMDALTREYALLVDQMWEVLGQGIRVYSKTDGNAAAVSRIWCDNSWDTQRRRGLTPTGRSVAYPTT